MLLPAVETLSALDLYRTSTYRMGANACHVIPRMAFRNNWSWVESADTREGVDEKLRNTLSKDMRRWRLKMTVQSAACCSAWAAASIAFIRPSAAWGRKRKDILRVAPVFREMIEWNGPEPSVIRPVIREGNMQVIPDLGPEEVVWFIHNPDPMGNGYQGIPAHYFAYKSILRAERVTRAYSNLIENRGMGIGLVGVHQGDLSDEDLRKYTVQFGNPGSRAWIFYPKNRFEINVQPGINTGFNYEGTDERFTRHMSMATGIPGMRAEGVQTGMVTGSKTDQDSVAENYQWYHEMFEDSVIDLHCLVNPDMRDAEFELEFPFDIVMDAAEKAQILQMNVNSIMTGATLIPVGVAYKMLDIKLPEGVNMDMSVAEYENSVQQKLQPTPMMQFEKGPEEDEGEEDKPAEKKEKPKAGKDSLETTDPVIQKRQIARMLLETGELSNNKVNVVLRTFYPTGLGTSTLQALRKEVRS